MPGTNCVFPQCGVARHHVGVGIFKVRTRKADVAWKKDIIQVTENYRIVDENLGESQNLEMYMFKKDDIKFTSTLQNEFLLDAFLDKFIILTESLKILV